jgi:hypothetical protein
MQAKQRGGLNRLKSQRQRKEKYGIHITFAISAKSGLTLLVTRTDASFRAAFVC